MKNTIMALVLVLGSTAIARAAEQKSAPSFDTKKTEALSRIDERLKKMQDHRTCVAGATDEASLKKCHETMREYAHEKREEWREKRKEIRDSQRSRG